MTRFFTPSIESRYGEVNIQSLESKRAIYHHCGRINGLQIVRLKYRKEDFCDQYEDGNMKSRNNLVERKGFVDSVEIQINDIARLKVRFLARRGQFIVLILICLFSFCLMTSQVDGSLQETASHCNGPRTHSFWSNIWTGD